MSFREGYDLGHGRERRGPLEQCVGMVLAAGLDEIDLYAGHSQAKQNIAEEIASQLFKDGENWQEHFADGLTTYQQGEFLP